MFKLRVLAIVLGCAVLGAGAYIQPAPAAAAPLSDADAVVRWGKYQLGKPFRLGADGLRRYDCSGLVYRTFLENGLASRIGGDRRARGYYKWFRDRGLVTNNPRKGDLVVWGLRGKPVSHIGIFIGYNRRGQPMALSALTGGVAIHRANGINKPLRAYLRVNIDR